MNDLHPLLITVLSDRHRANAARIRELATPLTEEEFWQKPFAFGNSLGHLVLHLTGNLNYYIGARIAQTGYVRDRPGEFADSNRPAKEQTLRGLDEAVAMVIDTLENQSPDDWAAEYSATGSNSSNRLAMIVQCAAHMQHHIGQMIYLVNEVERQAGAKP
jgi:uncharacterized damage-inducible protein DinB